MLWEEYYDTGSRQGTQKTLYFGDTKITLEHFEEVCQQIAAGEKLEAIKRIRMWTHLSLADAVHVVDNFNSIDFSRPQARIHVNKPNKNTINYSKGEKAQNVAKTVGKGVGMTAFVTGALGLRVISNLTKMYSKKRK